MLVLVVACGRSAAVPSPGPSPAPPGTVASAAAATTAASAGSAADAAPATPAPATGARVTLDARGKHFLGENVLVDYCVTNTGAAPFTIDVGGDYRGSSRSLRFKVQVRDAHGTLMADPDPHPYNLGGMSYSPSIAPGTKWCQSLPLARYARIDAAGTYAIRVTHDLGWPKGTAPAGTGSVELVTPDAAEAAAVVARMDALPRDPNREAGKVSIPYADFSALRYEVYVAPLRARARAGSVDAVSGLAEIPTSDATRALVSLLGAGDVKVRRAAAGGLAMRLPDPALAGGLPPRNVFANEMTDQRKYLSSHAWRAAFTGDVRAAAHKLLLSTDVGDVQSGAFMMEAVGTPPDLAGVTSALTTAIDRTRTVPPETDVYPTPRGACQELLRAALILLGRGASPAASPHDAGETAVWLVALGQGARPAGWEAELGRALAHRIAYVRQLALQRTPAPVPARMVPAVAADLAHPDPDVQVAAAQLAQRGKLVALVKPVLAIVAHAKDDMRLNAAINAAGDLGARYDCALVLAGRIPEPAMSNEVLGELVSLLDEHGYGSSGAPSPGAAAALARRWKLFIVKHKAQIEAGTRIPIDASVPPDLVPSGWTVHRRDGTSWP